MNPSEALDRAARAESVLGNQAYQDAYASVRQRLVDAMLSLKIEDDAEAMDFRRCIKLLDALKGELDGAIRSGKLVAANVAEIEARRKNPLRGIFR